MSHIGRTVTVRMRCEECGGRFAATRRDTRTCSTTCRQRLYRRMRAATPPLPDGPFDLILADPPWHFTTYSAAGQVKSPSAHYATLSIAAIKHLPIARVGAPDCGLAMWVYGPRLPEALDVMKAWGFKYKSDLLTWFKTTASGGPAFGNGYFTRKNTEQMIYGTRGDGLKAASHSVRQALHAPRGRHSQKPVEAYEALEKLFGPVRRLELFARACRPGWEAWGNELTTP